VVGVGISILGAVSSVLFGWLHRDGTV